MPADPTSDAPAVPTRRDGTGAAVLYLSYDGMTDPLGASQVLPYLAGLSALGHRITLVSFEKQALDSVGANAVADECARAGISWRPSRYHKSPPILSTLRDLWRMRRIASDECRRGGFDWVHCRSTLPAMVGQSLKRRFGLRFLFDMRGFWADERVEGGLWPLDKPLFAAIYRFFKQREADLLRHADAIVSLTHAAVPDLRARLARLTPAAASVPIHVIPCCVDFAAFPPVDAPRRAAARIALGIDANRRVCAYLGSIGTWYMLGEMLDAFAVLRRRVPDALFLIVTRDAPAPILAAASARGLPANALMIRSAARDEVATLVAAADVGLFFIRATYSKTASCPTKLGEFLAVEIPVIANRGVGDVDQVLAETRGGVLVDDFSDAACERAFASVEALDRADAIWRSEARRWFDLGMGVAAYDAIYRAAPSDSNSATSRGA